MSARDRVIDGLHRGYKYVVSPALHTIAGTTGACRFQPTCSEYAAIAVSEYGVVRGSWMALRRLLRCHPFRKGGFDPVQPNPQKHHEDLPALHRRPLP
ncbi:MAG TPA: membrane protein insertion efficiency factor YidD [Acidobacteriaceae bacterium]|nr:membrane protein insertion efficiency factor YidD [Acidobacteriaceae bacterium]